MGKPETAATVYVKKFGTMVSMKSLLLSIALLVLAAVPAYAQTASASASPSPSPSPSPAVQGLYDDLTATDSASFSATPTPTPLARTTTYSTAATPETGATENTIVLLLGGTALIALGVRFSKSE